MAFSEAYRRQVDLLLRVIPFITKETCFALKGGTAINLFVRDLPRLSVDIDLTYIPVFPRPKSLGAIDKAMKRIAARIAKGNKATRTSSSIHEGAVTKLVVREHDVQIIIEVTPVLRGCAYEPEMRSVTASVEEQFGFAEMRVLAFADLYAGKIGAALDRQHPRDLFDVRVLLSAEGITDEIRSAFIVYLLSHTRPMWEVLTARPKDIKREFEQNFSGMTTEPVDLQDLLDARSALVRSMVSDMPDRHRRFLVSFEKGEPDWELLDLAKVDKLPAVKWRTRNLDSITQNRRAELVAQLERVLGMDVTPKQLTLMPEKSAPTKKPRRNRTRSGA